MKVINPATNEFVKEYPEDSWKEVSAKLNDAETAFRSWKKTAFAKRAELLKKTASILRQRSAEFAGLMALEMGKPIAGGQAEIEKCAWVCEYYAENAEKFLQDEFIKTDAAISFITYQPLGAILAVMPWNFPFWQVFRFAAPNLMAGNSGILKHASNVPGCALAIEQIFRQAGFPQGVFQTLLIGGNRVEDVIRHPVIKAVTLTGSTPAGKAVAAAAGAVLKKCVLELGGSDPYLIFADADIDAAVNSCLASRLHNSGQSCISAKRLLVVDEIREEFTLKFVQKMKIQKLGDPFDPATTIGPLARMDLRDELHQQVCGSIAQGAKCLLGGYIPEWKGAYYPATVLTDVKKGMIAFEEELFGPAAAIIPVKDEEEAITLANSSRFGLGAAIFSKNEKKAQMIAAREIDAGNCFVNDLVKSDPRLPFGGIKESGFGRELSGSGLLEFINIKTVVIK